MFQQQKNEKTQDAEKSVRRKHVDVSAQAGSLNGIHRYSSLYSVVPRQPLAYTENIAVPDFPVSQVVQCRKAFLFYTDRAEEIETDRYSSEDLWRMIQLPGLMEKSKEQLMSAIMEGETLDSVIADENYQTARAHLTFLREGLAPAPDTQEKNHWVRNITGGGPNTFSSKRKPDGHLCTNMSDSEYDSLESLTCSFYDAAENLAEDAPRMHKLTLYRGIRIPQIEEGASKGDIERIVSGYSDVIPSSASWDMATPQRFSKEEKGQDGVIFHMIVPPDFPLVMLSYPREAEEGDPKPLDIPGQQEVLAGASEFSSVRLLKIEEQGNSRCYHMQVTLRAVPRRNVFDQINAAREAARPVPAPSQPVIMDEVKYTQRVVQRVFGNAADQLEINGIYEHNDYPGVKYRYIEHKGFFYVFKRIDENSRYYDTFRYD